MRRETIEGIKIRLRPMNDDDATFMSELRNNPVNKKYLSNRDQTISLEDQLRWMKGRYASDDCVDFIIELKKENKKVGNIAIYDVDNNEAELGRYICENSIGTIEAEYLCLKYAFEIIGLNKIYCKTVKKNEKVWQQHFKFGFIKEGEDYDDRISEARIIQTITNDQFSKFDYSPILNLLKRF